MLNSQFLLQGRVVKEDLFSGNQRLAGGEGGGGSQRELSIHGPCLKNCS